MGYRKAERGSVFFVILIGVAIFAALSYAVSKDFVWVGGHSTRLIMIRPNWKCRLFWILCMPSRMGFRK
jgi:hypothetical protein